MLNIALLGAGRIGQVHGRTLSRLENARAVAVADAIPSAAAKLAASLGASVQDVDDIMADPAIDAVVIGTPTDTHFDLIHAAAKAGKAIFCEKPVDLSADRTEICVKAAEKAGVPLLIAFNRRFDPNFAALEQRLRAGEIGDIEMVSILSRDPGPPPLDYIPRSGGLFRDMTIHDFDMARFLLAEEPIEVHAIGSVMVDPNLADYKDVDTAMVNLRTARGALVHISNSRRATYGYDQRVEVHGAKGMLRADNHYETTVESATAEGFRRAPLQNFFLERYEAAYQLEMLHFIDALERGVQPRPTGEDGLRAQRLADAATESLASGKPVKV